MPNERNAALLERFDVAPWEAVLVPGRHDAAAKTPLGVTGDLDAAAVIDILLDHPATAITIASKLLAELVGTEPSPQRLKRLAAVFRREYAVMDLVHAIVDGPELTADEAIRNKIRTPLEQAIGVMQAIGPDPRGPAAAVEAPTGIGYVPFRAPNPSGYPDGVRLLSPPSPHANLRPRSHGSFRHHRRVGTGDAGPARHLRRICCNARRARPHSERFDALGLGDQLTGASPDMTPHRSQLGACPTVTRRHFLASLGATVAVAAAGSYGISVWGRDSARAAAGPPPRGFELGPDRTLVVIEMGGGNDALNTVVPNGNDRYFDLRGNLAVADAIDLDGEVGLHPELGFLAAEFAAGRLAIVAGVGYPDPDLSHFASMSTWWSGSDAAVGGTGWLGRYLNGTTGMDRPLAGVTIGQGPSPAMRGDHSFAVTIQDVSGLTPAAPAWIDSRDELLAMWSGFAPAPFDQTTMLGIVRDAIASTVGAASNLNPLLADVPAGGTELGDAMRIAAALIASAEPEARLRSRMGRFRYPSGAGGQARRTAPPTRYGTRRVLLCGDGCRGRRTHRCHDDLGVRPPCCIHRIGGRSRHARHPVPPRRSRLRRAVRRGTGIRPPRRTRQPPAQCRPPQLLRLGLARVARSST